jgi:hypothetical protein
MRVVSSDSFMHFTNGGLDILKLILQNGFRVSLCDEVESFIHVDTKEELLTSHAIPMVCFCDIPPPVTTEHAAFYCKNDAKPKTEIFGIGMKRNWGLRVGLNPVAYTSPSSYSFDTNEHERILFDFLIHEHLKNRVSGTVDRVSLTPAIASFNVHLKNHQGFSHPYPRRMFFDKLTVGNYYRMKKGMPAVDRNNIVIYPYKDYFEIIPDHNFYNEREWRFIPPNLGNINVFQSTIKDRYKAEIIRKEDGIVFDEEFANEAFYCYLTEKMWHNPGYLRYNTDDISVIIVDGIDAKNELIASLPTLTGLGGWQVVPDVAKLSILIQTYEEYQNSEDV